MFNIVLVNPEIPPNTGNISRTCAVTGTRLHLIRPLGFEINDKTLKRAGLDYWKDLDVSYYDSFEELEAKYSDGIRIPMRHDQRSLNLSNSAAIVLYEALRQTGFQGLE